MPVRNLDVAMLRALAAVVDQGGVTAAAARLNLTQSAVSMQIRRLEALLGCRLFDRVGRRLRLTPEGEQMLGYARRIVALNDEAVMRLTHEAYSGTLVLGVPDDIIHPHVPGVLRRFAAAFPRVRLQLVASMSVRLRRAFVEGRCDVILTTETAPGQGGELLAPAPLVWIGARGGEAWARRPLPIAFERGSNFRAAARAALDSAGISWEVVVEADESRTVEASVAADLAVLAWIAGTEPAELAPVPAEAGLPALPPSAIILYGADSTAPGAAALCGFLREAFGGGLAVSRS